MSAGASFVTPKQAETGTLLEVFSLLRYDSWNPKVPNKETTTQRGTNKHPSPEVITESLMLPFLRKVKKTKWI